MGEKIQITSKTLKQIIQKQGNKTKEQKWMKRCKMVQTLKKEREIAELPKKVERIEIKKTSKMYKFKNFRIAKEHNNKLKKGTKVEKGKA